MQILLANPRGFCAGIDRAISIVERALEIYGAPIYVRHEVVHNRYVVNDLRERGAIFIEEISEVPDNAILIFSFASGIEHSKSTAASLCVRPLQSSARSSREKTSSLLWQFALAYSIVSRISLSLINSSAIGDMISY